MTEKAGEAFADLVARRSSTRRFLSRRVPQALLEKVRKQGERAEPLTGAVMEFLLLIEGERAEPGITGLLGGYGRVIRAPHYIVLLSRADGCYLLDCGFRFEQMILEATRVGLGSCWVGGFFNEERLARALGAGEDMRPVVLSPLGYPDFGGSARIIDGAMKLAVGASKRKPVEELFFWREAGRSLPVNVSGDRVFRFAAEAVRRAPSWANRQPWRFILRHDGIFLYKAGSQVKEGKDYHLVDCGIAMAHLHLALRALGRGGRWVVGGEAAPEAPAGSVFIGKYTVDGSVFGPG